MNFRIGLASSALLALSACQTCPTVTAEPPEVVTKTRIVDTACDWTRAIYLNKSDVLSDETAKAILAHDQAGAKACNWKPLK